MTMREAIAFSSNVYFYYISGGYGDQPGLGITKMHHYFDKFGFGKATNIDLDNEQIGTLPSPAWKQEVFNDDWRLGDTYLTSIGQFGFQTTPIQLLRAYAALGNGGLLVTPHVQKGEQGAVEDLQLNQQHLRVIQEGMRMTVNYPGGTARGLEKKYVAVAAKSGTAEIGAGNAYVNSWAAGYWPYENPQYAFILLMDRAPRSNTLGATTIMGQLVEWMYQNTPEYIVEATETE
jgi:penicillin-binding protein 2